MSERSDPVESTEARPTEDAGEAPRRFWQLPVQKALQQAWADAKQASQGVEDELRKRARAVFGRGDAPQQGEEVQGLVGELRERLQKSRQEFELKLNGSVQSAIERVQQPLLAEIAALKDRAEALGERLSAMRPGGKPGPDEAAEGEASSGDAKAPVSPPEG